MKTFLKKIYGYIPFKKQIYILLKVVWKPNESVFRHLHFIGIFNVKVGKKKSFKIHHYGYQIENEIFWAGLNEGWEKESVKLWIKLCEKADVILDIGANTGIYSLIAKAVNPKAQVYAFEPVHRVYEKLVQNIQLNQFDIVASEKAISNKNGIATIYDTNSEHVLSVTVNKNMNAPDIEVKATEIETISIDSFIVQNKLKRIDLIKIDVETHEPEVFEGFAVHISQFRPTLLVEVLNDEVAERLNVLVDGLDYLYFNIDELGAIRRVPRITKSDYYNYLLCNNKVASAIGLI